MTHADLIARLEAATGADRELDAEIARIVNPHFTRLTAAPSYTASIDAALTLVSEGWCWTLTASDLVGERWISEVWTRGTDEWQFSATAATPALALCIAALKAREVKP